MDWTSTEFVKEHMDTAARYVADAQVDFWRRWFANTSLESPLEVIFAIWWRALDAAGEVSSTYVSYEAQVPVTAGPEKRNYRLDFVLTPGFDLLQRAKAVGVAYPKLCVELDGHDFHERTKEQVAYRNQRDRDLQADGWTVLHYSGSEMHRAPAKCVADAFGHGFKLFGYRFEEAVMEAEWQAAERTAVNQEGALTTQES